MLARVDALFTLPRGSSTRQRNGARARPFHCLVSGTLDPDVRPWTQPQLWDCQLTLRHCCHCRLALRPTRQPKSWQEIQAYNCPRVTCNRTPARQESTSLDDQALPLLTTCSVGHLSLSGPRLVRRTWAHAWHCLSLSLSLSVWHTSTISL